MSVKTTITIKRRAPAKIVLELENGETIEVGPSDKTKSAMEINIIAPKTVKVYRGELYDKIKGNSKEDPDVA